MNAAEFLANLKADPNVSKIIQILEPTIPVLQKLAQQQGAMVLDSLCSPDPTYGLETLRAHATDDEWTAIAASLTADANRAVLEALNRDAELKAALWKIALSGLLMLLGML